MGWIVAVVMALVALWFFFDYRGAMRMYNEQVMLNRLFRGENYYRLVRFTHKGREYTARVRRWNVLDEPGKAELWCVEGSNPDGWTQFFLWPHDDLEFV